MLNQMQYRFAVTYGALSMPLNNLACAGCDCAFHSGLEHAEHFQLADQPYVYSDHNIFADFGHFFWRIFGSSKKFEFKNLLMYLRLFCPSLFIILHALHCTVFSYFIDKIKLLLSLSCPTLLWYKKTRENHLNCLNI